MTSRELARLGDQREIASSLALLAAERIVETAEATRGRHRSASAVRLTPGGLAAVKLAAPSSVKSCACSARPRTEALALEESEERIPGAASRGACPGGRGSSSSVGAASRRVAVSAGGEEYPAARSGQCGVTAAISI